MSSLNIRIKLSQKHKIRIRIFRHKFSAAVKINKHYVTSKPLKVQEQKQTE